MTDRMELTLDNLVRMSDEVRSDSGPASTTKAFNESLIAEFRANGGKLSGELARSRFLLLTTKGARSGKERISPLVYLTIDDRLLIIASMGGAPSSPAWYHNLVANPEVTVEIGTETYTARAVVTEGADRDDLFAKVCAKISTFTEYQSRTTRVIPVVELIRRPA